MLTDCTISAPVQMFTAWTHFRCVCVAGSIRLTYWLQTWLNLPVLRLRKYCIIIGTQKSPDQILLTDWFKFINSLTHWMVGKKLSDIEKNYHKIVLLKRQIWKTCMSLFDPSTQQLWKTCMAPHGSIWPLNPKISLVWNYNTSTSAISMVWNRHYSTSAMMEDMHGTNGFIWLLWGHWGGSS
jgi:hypothetical protein